MRKIKIYAVLTFAFVIAGSKVLSQNYFIGFFAESPIMNTFSPGHAFIGIGKGTPLTCDVNGDSTEMYGFYPTVRTQGGKSLWFGPVDGEIKNDVRTNIDLYFFKKIEFADYIRVQLKIQEWKNRQYQLTKQDCISFFIEVAKTIPGISIPDRGKFTLPETFVATFIRNNK